MNCLSDVFFFTCMVMDTQSGALSSLFMAGFSSFGIVQAEVEDLRHATPA
jgi:hypothetical protein